MRRSKGWCGCSMILLIELCEEAHTFFLYLESCVLFGFLERSEISDLDFSLKLLLLPQFIKPSLQRLQLLKTPLLNNTPIFEHDDLIHLTDSR